MEKGAIKLLTYAMLLLLSGCWNKNEKNSKDKDNKSFSSDWNHARVPLINAYYLKKLNPRHEFNKWTMVLKNKPGITNVEQVDINNSIIYVCCGDSTLFDFQYVKAAWHIVDTKTDEENGFTDSTKFIDFIIEKKYPKPTWKNVDSLYNVTKNQR
jgi:hypothetical protein